MLRAGGADMVVLGFRRSDHAPAEIQGAAVADLGRTFDGRLGHRAAATLWAALTVRHLKSVLQGADVIMARTLEMLMVAQAARSSCG